MATPETAQPLSPIGPYHLQHLHRSGGMALVYVAVHAHTGLRVALKVPTPEVQQDPHQLARFNQEGRALARIQHPGVVRVIDSGEDNGTAYLALEWIEGPNLREWLQTQPNPLSLPRALEVCQQLADALTEVHAQGIVHRDVKPENIVMAQQPGEGRGLQIKLLDFGIAKVPATHHGPLARTQADTDNFTFLG